MLTWTVALALQIIFKNFPTVTAHCKNYANVRFKLTFIRASALVAMRSTYTGQLMRASAAPLILRMHT